ncbi:MAG: Fe-S cluster assembly protein SufD, partial [Gammaproteobacteria bacterium]|nr:Fe-S cluster assembly protein SufD [Gammaproteobacteria bacterium]
GLEQMDIPAGASLAALNAAFLTDAVQIDIAANKVLDRPLHLVFVADGSPVSIQTRVLLTLGERSEATVIEQFVSDGAATTNTISHVECAPGARLHYLKLQDESGDAHHIAAQRLLVARNARVDALHIDLGARLARNDLTVELLAAGAEASMHGLFVGDSQRHIDNHTRVDHRAPHTHSVASYRGVLNDQSRGVFNGKILVHDDADGTDASLENRNLLLSQQAEIDTKPELEIYADDVKCSHGATTGQLDPAAIFYLRSRGVADADARRMLTLAFAAEITHRSPLQSLREHIEHQCGARIDADQAEEQFA